MGEANFYYFTCLKQSANKSLEIDKLCIEFYWIFLHSPSTICAKKMTDPAKSVKRDWYQNDTHVIITVLIKKVNKDDVNVDYGQDSIDFSVKIPDTDATYQLNLRLAGKIEKEACAFKVTPTKIEIRLKKADLSRWSVLEADGSANSNVKSFEVAPSTEPAAAYPTSSKKPKDWDRLEREVKAEEKDEKLEGDAALNKLFQESNGTVLSTNWGEIGGKKTEMQCPDGMEFKQ